MTDGALARFLELCAREMDADDVRALPRGEAVAAPNVLIVPLGEALDVVVRFPVSPVDLDARLRRLEMLAAAFETALEGAKRRPHARRSLRHELQALAARADAVDALVIDAHSPVVWGAAGPIATPNAPVIPLKPEDRRRIERIQESHRDLIAALGEDLDDDEDEPVDRASAPPPPPTPNPLSARAVADVRAHPATAMLHRGRHLAHSVRSASYGLLARSFAAIYVLILVFDKPFDEIRAERAMREGLHEIEKLVLALPPLDPAPGPTAGVVSMRGRRRH